MSLTKSLGLVPFIVLSFIFSDCPDGTDVCLSLDGNNLNYESTTDIAGFQFNHNGCVFDTDGNANNNASGGDAAANGFTISASNTVVLAFSFTGAVVPAGTGTIKNDWNRSAIKDDEKFLSEREVDDASKTQVNQ